MVKKLGSTSIDILIILFMSNINNGILNFNENGFKSIQYKGLQSYESKKKCKWLHEEHSSISCECGMKESKLQRT